MREGRENTKKATRIEKINWQVPVQLLHMWMSTYKVPGCVVPLALQQ